MAPTCGSCGGPAALKCTQCGGKAYCSQACQRKDWKEHKKVCFPEGAKCTRCLEVITAANLARCEVPHPTHMLQGAGSMMGGGSSSWNFSCEACGGHFTKTSSDYNGKDTAPITRGARFCYEGPHTIKPIKKDDERRVCADVLVLAVGADLQQKINSIPSTMPDVRVLTIQSTGCYDDSVRPSLEIPMPKLETLKLEDVCFRKVTLNPKLTPNVEELSMQNIPDGCELTVLLPELRSFSMHYYGPPDDSAWINNMLSTATKLESFDSYKLRVGPELDFASNNLKYIRLHRAELLESLSVYAPRLQELSLQACYGLDGELTILDSHPDHPSVPGRPSAFFVNTANACISPSIARVLNSNPRVMHDDSGGNPANPMEAMFRWHAWRDGFRWDGFLARDFTSSSISKPFISLPPRYTTIPMYT